MSGEEDLRKRMEYMQDVAGWKSIIFLPYQRVWQCIIMVAVILVFLTSTSRATFRTNTNVEVFISYVCDALYFIDTVCSVLHHYLADTRKLRSYKTKSWILIVIDGISLIPIEIIYLSTYLSKKMSAEYSWHEIWYCLFLNRILRIYRVYYYFQEYQLTVTSLKYGHIFSSITLYIFSLCLTHLATCIYHAVKTEDDLKFFEESMFEYVFIEEVDMYFLMSLRFNGNFRKYNTTKKRICVTVFMVIGYFYLYTGTLPRMILSFQKIHRTFFDLWNRYRRLTMFIENVIEDIAMEKKILNMFRTVWTYGKGDIEPELLQSFPLNIRKNISSDLYWDALRHSDLLQNVSRSCKRALAMKIAGNFYEQGTIFWDLEENKKIFLYIASGILQIMSVENEESPIISFSGGTVLGEAALFYQNKSKAILRVATFAEIHVLQAKDFFRVIKDYPNDRKMVFENLKLRLQLARATQFRQKEIRLPTLNRDIVEMQSISGDKFDSVKWIKLQFRQIIEIEGLLSKHGTVRPSHLQRHELNKLKASIDHTSLYLPLLNLGEDMEIITDQTCLKTTIPWVIDPNSSFIQHWRFIILCFITLSSVIYPFFIGWWPTIPHWLNSLSLFISMFHICDLIIQLSTAIKTKDEFIAKSGPIFRYRFRRLPFYADFIAAFPFDLILDDTSRDKHSADNVKRIVLALSLVKAYRLVGFLQNWCKTLKGTFSTRVMIKYLIYVIFMTYWAAAFLQLSDVRCLFWSCSSLRWYKAELEQLYPGYREFASIFFSGSCVINLSSIYDHMVTFPTVIFVGFTLTVSKFILFSWTGEYVGSYISESSQKIKFMNLLQSINTFMNERNIEERIIKKVRDTMHFQWIYDCGDYLTQKQGMLEDVPSKLIREVNKATIFKSLRKCDAFISESDSFIGYLCRRSKLLVLPANSVIVTYGTQPKSVYIIYKGCIQVNSFLPKDTIGGIAKPCLFGPGEVIPFVVAMKQIPASITAKALTDCELISIPLEALLAGLLINDCLKDFTDAIKKVDSTEFRKSRLVFTKTVKHLWKKDPYYNEPFKKISYFAWFLRRFLMRRTIRSDGTLYIAWEAFRVLTFIILSILWPFVFALPHFIGRIYLVHALLGLESITWVDFYIKMHVGYYNSKGLYISHPLSTFTHYMSTTFILELFAFTPYLHCIYILLTKEGFEFSNIVEIIHCILRIFALYRLVLFCRSFSEMKSTSILRPLCYSLILLIIVNCFIVLKLGAEVKWVYHSNGEITHTFKHDGWIGAVQIENTDTFGELYIIMIFCVTMLTFSGDTIFKQYTFASLGLHVFLSVFGFILSFLLLAAYLSHKRSLKMNFVMFQYHMKRLRNFLKVEKVEDELSMEAIKYFEHEWETRQESDLHEIFSRFPNVLHEDMMNPIYRGIFLTLPCFQNANDGFFRSLSRYFIEVYFNKKSFISFEKAVHTDIYFVFSGLCYVKEDNVILGKGSIIGDIKRKGKMTNNIQAQTHVVLLYISSEKFFSILNNYAYTEAAFFEAIRNLSDYMKSNYNSQDIQDLQDEADWTKTTLQTESCVFELATDKEEFSLATSKKIKMKKQVDFFIHPASRVAKLLLTIFILDATITVFIIPLIISLKLKNTTFQILVNFLDAIWVIKILVSFRTAYISSDTGNLVTNRKVIFKNYLKSSDGIFIDILCVIPFEYFYLILSHYIGNEYSDFEKYCYALRLLRLFSLWVRVKKEKRKLSLSDWTKWIIIIVKEFIVLHFLTCINILLATEKEMYIPETQNQFSEFLLNAYLWSFLTVCNFYVKAGFNIFPSTSLIQIVFKASILIISMFQTYWTVCEAVGIIQVGLYISSDKIYRMQLMQKFVEVRNLSPFLKSNLMRYAYDLMNHYHGEVEPPLLETAPYYIKVEIKKNLYLKYLNNCFVFQEIPQDFMKQLAARLKRHAFFPSDVITEKGDVDCCMYFIHNGEVSSIESDRIYHGLDYEVQKFGVGDYFGLEQGLSHAIPHTTTYRAQTKVDLLILNYYQWKDLRLAFPEVRDIIKSNLKEYYVNKNTV